VQKRNGGGGRTSLQHQKHRQPGSKIHVLVSDPG
jgi:hypothetical protein